MVLHPFRTSFFILCSLHNSALHVQKQIFHIFEYARGWCNGNSRQFRQFYVSIQLKQWSCKTRFVKGKKQHRNEENCDNRWFQSGISIATQDCIAAWVSGVFRTRGQKQPSVLQLQWLARGKKIHHFWKEIQNILAESLSMGQYGDQSSQTPRRWGHSFDSTIQHERYHKFARRNRQRSKWLKNQLGRWSTSHKERLRISLCRRL